MVLHLLSLLDLLNRRHTSLRHVCSAVFMLMYEVLNDRFVIVCSILDLLLMLLLESLLSYQ